MKLSTRSRYGTRLMLDMAPNYHDGPIHLSDIAKRQDVSVKYLVSRAPLCRRCGGYPCG